VTAGSPSRTLIRFGVFELDTESGELRRQGLKVRLQEQPFQILQVLLEQPGRVVTREELQQRIWPSDTFVDFDSGLYNAIKKLREALGDSAENPRFIETLSRRGYRFIAAVEGNTHAAAQTQIAEVAKPARNRNVRLGIVLGLAAAIALVAVLGGGKLRRRLFRANTVPQIDSIAVLPLQNLSGDPNQEYFSDGMTDALITSLAELGSLKVISRTSSMQYKPTGKSLPEIARELNVDGIVEGTVQRSGDRVRITAQLIQGSTDKHLWANSYERQLRDVFALEQEVAADIARQVQAKAANPRAQPRPVDPRVLDAVVLGNYYLGEVNRGAGDEGATKARAYFQQAIDLDPGFAPAYVGLANSYDPQWYGRPGDLALMRKAAEKAVELDPNSSDAWAALADAKGYAWDWSGAEQGYRQALVLNPNNADAHDNLANLLDIMGLMDEAWKEYQIAQELDPEHDHLSMGLYLRRQYDRALEIQQRVVKRDPGDGLQHYFLAGFYAQKGMDKQFTQEMATAFATLFGSAELGDRLRRAYERSGRRGVLEEWAKEMEEGAANKRFYLPGVLVRAYAMLGDRDRSFYWMEEFRRHHDRALADFEVHFKADPVYHPLRSDPRFAEFLRRVGLPP